MVAVALFFMGKGYSYAASAAAMVVGNLHDFCVGCVFLWRVQLSNNGDSPFVNNLVKSVCVIVNP